MSYQPLVLDAATPPRVKRVIEKLEKLSFSDVHTMLRLPIPNYRLNAGCNLAITQVLLTAVGGLSTTLYRHGSTDGTRFMGLLRDHYPWSLEPTQHVRAEEAARIIYQIFRNPLTHQLGFDLHGRSKGIKVVVKRLERPQQQGGMPERWIEKLEKGLSRPHMSPAVTVRSDAKVLLVEALYWGLRRMVETMSRSTQLMANAESFLATKF